MSHDFDAWLESGDPSPMEVLAFLFAQGSLPDWSGQGGGQLIPVPFSLVKEPIMASADVRRVRGRK